MNCPICNSKLKFLNYDLPHYYCADHYRSYPEAGSVFPKENIEAGNYVARIYADNRLQIDIYSDDKCWIQTKEFYDVKLTVDKNILKTINTILMLS